MTIGAVPNSITAAGRALDRAVRRIEDAEAIARPWMPARHALRLRGLDNGLHQAQYGVRLLAQEFPQVAVLQPAIERSATLVDRSWPASATGTTDLLSQLRGTRDDIHELLDAGITTRAGAEAELERLRALAPEAWTAADLDRARSVHHVLRAPDASSDAWAVGDPASDRRNRVMEILQMSLPNGVRDDVPRRAQAFRSTWEHADRESATWRLRELIQASAIEPDTPRWREIHALLTDVPEDIRPSVPSLELSKHPGNVTERGGIYFPGFGRITTHSPIGTTMKETHQAAMHLAALGDRAPQLFREEFVNTLGDTLLVEIRTALDPEYLTRVEDDLRAAFAAGAKPLSTGHPGDALAKVGLTVVREAPNSLESARRAAQLAEGIAGSSARPYWASIRSDVDRGAFVDLPAPLQQQLDQLLTTNLGRMDGTVANAQPHMLVADYGDLGRVQSIIDTASGLAPRAAVAEGRGVSAAPPAAGVSW